MPKSSIFGRTACAIGLHHDRRAARFTATDCPDIHGIECTRCGRRQTGVASGQRLPGPPIPGSAHERREKRQRAKANQWQARKAPRTRKKPIPATPIEAVIAEQKDFAA